jgi:hypothetical protein
MKSPVAKIKLYPEGPLKILPGEKILFTVEKIFAAGGSEKIPTGKIKWVTGGTIFIPNAMDQKTGIFTAHGTGGGTAEVTAYYGKMSDKVSIDIQTWRRTVKITVYEKDKDGNPTTIPVENALVYNSSQKGNTDHLGVVVFKDSLPGSGGYTVEADGYTTLNSPAVKVPSVGSAAAAKIPFKATFYLEKDCTPVELILDPKLFRATDLGETFQLRASVVYKDGSKEDVTDKTSWSSDDRSAATVTKDGLVTIMDTANDGATATITASYTGFKRSAQSSVTATCEIHVTLGDSIVDFTVLPSSPKVDEKTTFAVNFKTSQNVKSTDTFVWYLRKHGEAGKKFATGPTISYVFKDKDDYYIELKVMRSGEEKGSTEKMISTETKPIIAKGYKCEWRGRMDGKKLTITKHNWNGQKKKFSEQPDRTETYYSIDSWDLRTGQIEQAPIFNPGYLVYASNKCIHYAILSYEVEQIHAGVGGKTQPNYEFSGTVSQSCGKLATKNLNLSIGSVLSRGFTVSWNDKDGAACRATIERYTGNIEKDSFLCEKGKPLVAPIIVFEPKDGIDTNIRIIFSVTNAGDNPGSTYAWTLDGKVRGETSAIYSTKLSKGPHSIAVTAENRFGAKKAGNSLTISVKEAKKKKTGITPEDIVQLIKEGKAEEAYKLLMGMDDDASETLLSKLSDEEVEAILDAGEPAGEESPLPPEEKVTADEISELIKEGKVEEANEILMTLPDEAAGEILSELTENEVEEIMGASEPEEMGKPSESGTPPEPEAIAQTVSNLIKSGKEEEAGALLLETPDEITEEILNSLTPEEIDAVMQSSTAPVTNTQQPETNGSNEKQKKRFFQSFNLPVDGTTVQSHRLSSGKKYLIEFSGTFQYDTGEIGELADAMHYEDDSHNWQNEDWIKLNGSFIQPSTANREKHIYSVTFTGRDKPITLKLQDSYYKDNAGCLLVRIFEMDENGTRVGEKRTTLSGNKSTRETQDLFFVRERSRLQEPSKDNNSSVLINFTSQDWNLAKPNQPSRAQIFDLDIPEWATHIILRVSHGYDDTGDKKVQFTLKSPHGKQLLNDMAGSRGAEEFETPVDGYGRYRLTFTDKDTDSGGGSPGNGGSFQIFLRGAVPAEK